MSVSSFNVVHSFGDIFISPWQGEMLFRLFSILYKLYTSSFGLLKLAPHSSCHISSKSTKPSWRWHLPFALLCRASLSPCCLFHYLLFECHPQCVIRSPEKVLICKWGLYQFTSRFLQACFLWGLYLYFHFLNFVFNCKKLIIYKRFFTFSLSEWFCPSIILSKLPTTRQKEQKCDALHKRQ